MPEGGAIASENAGAKYLALHAAISAEITRLRNDQWVLSGYFISEAVGVIYLFSADALKGVLTPGLTGMVVLVQIAAMLVYLYHIVRLHRFLYVHRHIRRTVEEKLGFHSIKDSKGEFVFPNAWRDKPVDRWFEFNTVVIPLAAFVILTQALSLYVILSQ